MPTAGLGTMRNVAKQSAQTVMRADGLQQALGERRRLPRSSKARTSFAEVPGRSGKSDINNTHGQLNDAVTHDSLVSWRNKSFRRGNQYQWQLQQTNQTCSTDMPLENIFHTCTQLQKTIIFEDLSTTLVHTTFYTEYVLTPHLYTHKSVPDNPFTRNSLAHSCPRNTCTRNALLSHTALSPTALSHTTLPNTPLLHTTPLHTHWYASHLQMKDQGRKLSCKNDRLQQFLCLLVLLLDTYFLEKRLLHFMKKIAVRPSKVQHPERHTACADLYCKVVFAVRDTNKCS